MFVKLDDSLNALSSIRVNSTETNRLAEDNKYSHYSYRVPSRLRWAASPEPNTWPSELEAAPEVRVDHPVQSILDLLRVAQVSPGFKMMYLACVYGVYSDHCKSLRPRTGSIAAARADSISSILARYWSR